MNLQIVRNIEDQIAVTLQLHNDILFCYNRCIIYEHYTDAILLNEELQPILKKISELVFRKNHLIELHQ